MSSIILNLNKQFENRVRLGIMSILIVNDWVAFNLLKEMLEVTDGNLASHLNALEKNGTVGDIAEVINNGCIVAKVLKLENNLWAGNPGQAIELRW